MRFLILAFFVCGSAFSAEPKDVWPLLEKKLTDAGCQKRAKEFSEFRLLLAVPEFQDALANEKALPKLRPVLKGWSSDLLLKVALQLDVELRGGCVPFPPFFEDLTLELKRAFLERLGVPTDGVPPRDVDYLFRGLVSLKEDAARFTQVLEKAKLKKPVKRTLLKLFFHDVTELDGVVVVGNKPFPKKQFKAFLKEACPDVTNQCPFWDSRVIYKVVVTSEPGIAAYVSEVATLVLSESLFEPLNRLHKVVLLHELAHVAERSAWLVRRQAWMAEFAAFSGWKRADSGEWSANVEKLPDSTRNDELTKLSATSPFSILPDPVILAKGVTGKDLDGFVLAKGYEESVRENDPAEDLADHVAVYRFAPERFCYGGKNIAPQKFQWITEKIFKKPPVLSCDATKK